jgi:hypothetical protein
VITHEEATKENYLPGNPTEMLTETPRSHQRSSGNAIKNQKENSKGVSEGLK